MLKAMDLNMIYKRLAKQLITHGKKVGNTTELNNVSFTLENTNNCIISIEDSKITSYKYLLAENIWYASGDNKLSFIGKYAKKWQSISDDNITSNSAYGYIIQHKYKFNQIEKVISILSKDKNSRRAVININAANENIDTTKDEECTMYLQFFVRNNFLNCSTCMRSNDIYFGLPYDVPAFIGIQKYIAHRLKLLCGTYTHFAGSLHVYDEQYNKIASAINGKIIKPKYYVDYITLYKACLSGTFLYNFANNNPDKLVDFCKEIGVLNEIH